MNLNKKTQYGILLCLYLGRSGRASIDDIATSFRLSKDFMYQVANKLTKAGVLASFKGPTGGYELKSPNVSLLDVVQALSRIEILPPDYFDQCMRGTPEERALAHISAELQKVTKHMLDLTIAQTNLNLVNYELAALDTADDDLMQ